MASPQVNVLLTDTCSVYKLFFFARDGIIPQSSISISGLGNLEFHSIVLEEFESDIQAFHYFKNIIPQPKKKGYPLFLDVLGESFFSAIEKFIKDNLTTIKTTSSDDGKFLVQRKIYDDYRKTLQDQWKKEGKFQNSKKATSVPSDEDYVLLYDSIVNNTELITNDEILFEVAKNFLAVHQKNSYMAEHVVRQVYRSNNNLKKKIEDCIRTMDYMSEGFQQSLVFN